MSATLTLTADLDDVMDFSRLPDAVRREVNRWRLEFELVQRPFQKALRTIAKKMGVSVQTANRKFYAWLNANGDWRVLVNRAKCPEPGRVGLPPETILYWQQLCGGNQRKCRPAYRKLIEAWRAGKEIPGFPKDAPRHVIPPGLSYQNLMRHKPTKFETVAARQGRSAAAAHRPLIYTTRENLWVGSHYLFDDMWHDHFVNILDTKQTGRPLEFHALDLFSACKFAWGMRVRTENVLTGKMEGLKEHMMRFLLASVLSDHGFSERGTIMVVEHGTAAIREELERLLHDLSGGRIKVSRSGMEGDPAFIGQYAGRAKGNFRFKAALETLGNLIHNEMASLPGQAGMDVNRRPEWLDGLLKSNDALMNAMVALAVTHPEKAAKLRMPLMSLGEFQEVALEIYDRINKRTEHALEGWGRQCTPDGSTGLMRRFSPWEVWQAGRPQLRKFDPASVALLLSKDLGKEEQIRSSMIEMKVKEISPDPMRFDCTAWRDGEKFLVVLNPLRPHELYLFDAQGRFKGVAPLIQRACPTDLEKLKRVFGANEKRLATLLKPVAAQGAEITKRRIEDMKHNAALLESAGHLSVDRGVRSAELKTGNADEPQEPQVSAGLKVRSIAEELADLDDGHQ